MYKVREPTLEKDFDLAVEEKGVLWEGHVSIAEGKVIYWLWRKQRGVSLTRG